MGIKNAEFYADFEFVDAGFKKRHIKSYKQKTAKECATTKIMKIRITFGYNYT